MADGGAAPAEGAPPEPPEPPVFAEVDLPGSAAALLEEDCADLGASDAGACDLDAAGPLRPRPTVDLEDRRAERRASGLVKWRLENGVPDVGGIGWRARNGHVLKNQAFYGAKPDENQWNNPTHAGVKTWREWHGPKLRRDAPLMQRLDQMDAAREELEADKAFVNTVRAQTLDRFYEKKVENAQKEIASQWAPHRRARKEVHSSLNSVAAELDSMPMKELKKVLTPQVLKADRDAIRMITKRLQVEETWKEAWRGLEKERIRDTRECHEQRMAYNAMLIDMSGQQPRVRDTARRLPNNCTARIEELARPTGPRHAGAVGDVTRLVDYKGLYHVDHRHALEARFPGQGHELSTTFADKVSASAKAGWPPPHPAETPKVDKRPRGGEGSIARQPVPVRPDRLDQARGRPDDEVVARHASCQLLPAEAPPPPEQCDQLPQEPLARDALQMGKDFTPRSVGSSGRDCPAGGGDQLGSAPALPSQTYHVTVPLVEGKRERPGWRPKRGDGSSRAGSLGSSPQTSRETWPPPNSREVLVKVHRANGLPVADRAGHSDPYIVCMVKGRLKSKRKTKIVEESENPVFDEELLVSGWRPGDPLCFSLWDHDLVGADDALASLEVPSTKFFPDGFSGTLRMANDWSAAGTRCEARMLAQNMAARPTMTVSIEVQEPSTQGAGLVFKHGSAHADLAMPHLAPTVAAVCTDLDDFERTMTQVPRLGNFCLTPSRRTANQDVQSAR